MTEQRAWHHASVRELPGVLVTAGRLLLAHWPALVALACLGIALRNGALWAAVELSDWHAAAGQALLLLAPIGYLLPVIGMLHVCRTSLPALTQAATSPGPEAPTERRERRLVDVFASVLIPFLTVYVSHGLLEEDTARFLNEVAADELQQVIIDPDNFSWVDRMGLWDSWTLVALIAIALVLRWGLGRLERTLNFVALALFGALLETWWTSQVANHANLMQSRIQSWAADRRAVDVVASRYDAAVTELGWLAHPVDAATTWLFDALGAFDVVVVTPLAWLTVAAVVLGHKLMPPPEEKHAVLDRLAVIPAPVRAAAGNLTSDIRSRFSGFWQGLRMLGAAGLAPMLFFGVAFLVVLRAPGLVSRLWREIAGPTETSTWLAFAPIEGAVGLAASLVLTMPLLAAAVEWLVRPTAAGTPGTSESRTSATPA